MSIAYQATEIPREWKKIIAIEFSCINRNSGGLSREQWCAVVLDEYGDLLLGHEELQVLINACGSEPDRLIAQAPFIEQAALEYRAFIQKSSGNKSLVNYEYNEIYGILFPAIIVLLKRPQHAVARRWTGIFFGIPEDDLISGPLLQIVPNDLEGILLSEAYRLTVILRDPFAMVPDLTRRTNEFLGTTNTIRDELGFILELPLQQGIPAPELGHAYEAMLSDYFAFSDHWSSEQSSRLQGYVLHFGFNLPVQSIFHRQTGLSLPMIYSFQQPLAQRPIRKAFIWKRGFALLRDRMRRGKGAIRRKGNRSSCGGWRDHNLRSIHTGL